MAKKQQIYLTILSVLLLAAAGSIAFLMVDRHNLNQRLTNALGTQVTDAYGYTREATGLLQHAMDNHQELWALDEAVKDLQAASDMMDHMAWLDSSRRQQWTRVQRGLSQAIYLISKTYNEAGQDSPTEAQWRIVGEARFMVAAANKALTAEITVGSSPRIRFDEQAIVEAVGAAEAFLHSFPEEG